MGFFTRVKYFLRWLKLNPIMGVTFIITVLLVVIVVGGPAYSFSNSPTFCSACHTMKPTVDTYLDSDHAKANIQGQCMACHGGVSVGPIQSKLAANLVAHGIDGPKELIAQIQGKDIHARIDYEAPHLENTRCLYCHSPDSTVSSAYPVTARDHKSPIDVSEKFQEALSNPKAQSCKRCHIYIVHPAGGKHWPYPEVFKNTVHPSPKVDTGMWKARHWQALKKGSIEDVNGNLVKVQKSSCKGCHQNEKAPENFANGKEACQNCHKYQ